MVWCGSTVQTTKENSTANWAKYNTSKTFFKYLCLTFNPVLNSYNNAGGTCSIILPLSFDYI